MATIVLANFIVYYWFNGQSAPVSDGFESSQPRLDIPSLVLLSEVESKHIRAIVESPPERTEPGLSNVNTSANQLNLGIGECWALGPVIDESIPQRLASEMGNFGFIVTARKPGVSSQSGFWVYLPPFSTFGALEAQRQALVALEIENFVIRNGKLKNGISLGYFNSEENARAKQAELALKGFRGQIDTSENIASSVWMSMSAQAFESLSNEFWLDMNRISPDLEVQGVACDIK
ncbi:MAG: hypothetical protein KUG71_02500 [Porticoccaceae bacterium]|nr:hypothetical protein [Porticoccaceae bacterium]